MSRFPQPKRFHHAGPDPGEHTTEVLTELGWDANEIDRLRRIGAIA